MNALPPTGDLFKPKKGGRRQEECGQDIHHDFVLRIQFSFQTCSHDSATLALPVRQWELTENLLTAVNYFRLPSISADFRTHRLGAVVI